MLTIYSILLLKHTLESCRLFIFGIWLTIKKMYYNNILTLSWVEYQGYKPVNTAYCFA